MNRPRLFIYILSFITAVFLLPALGMGQGPGDPSCDPLDPDCPIDGGLSLLIAAGIGLGAKKAYQERKKAIDKKEGSAF